MCGMDSTILMIHHFNYMKKKRGKSTTKKITYKEDSNITYTENIYKSDIKLNKKNILSIIH